MIVNEIVELGSAVVLTMGFGGGGAAAYRPRGWDHVVHNAGIMHMTQAIELGKVTTLTLGGYGNVYEFMRPSAQYSGR